MRSRQGIGAGEARIAPSELTVRDDGTIVFVQRGRLWAIGSDGRLRALPAPDGVLDVAAQSPAARCSPSRATRCSGSPATLRVLDAAVRAATGQPPALRAAMTEAVTHMPGGRILRGRVVPNRGFLEG